MIIPSIDIIDGHAVQLVGGKEKKIDAGDPRPIMEKFRLAGDVAVIDLDAALGYIVQAGTRIIDGEALDIDVVEDLEYGLVSEWVNGLDSLQSAIEDPEVVEEED
jgi:hypothetical protein